MAYMPGLRTRVHKKLNFYSTRIDTKSFVQIMIRNVIFYRRGKECNELSFFNPSYPDSRWNRVLANLNFEQYILTTPVCHIMYLF